MSYWSKEEEQRILATARLELVHGSWDLETVGGSYIEVNHAQILKALPQLGFDKDGEPIGDLVDVYFHTGEVVTISLDTNDGSSVHIYDQFPVCCSIP
ncbi:MAG: hypothetical protein RMX65_016570 [Nostoc sp. DedQUE01]|nr:hypothetical protein [Nostoc sp. DedQUE01]